MAVKITYMVQGTTQDNVDHLLSGHNDIDLLNPLGTTQAKHLGELREDAFDIIFTSDLKRAIKTAKLAFPHRCEHVCDPHLRECDFGDMTQDPKPDISQYITEQYPNGESYLEVQHRIQKFLKFLKENYDGKHVGIVAHQAPQLAMEVLINDKSWEEAIKQDWRNTKSWQPGWEFVLE